MPGAIAGHPSALTRAATEYRSDPEARTTFAEPTTAPRSASMPADTAAVEPTTVTDVTPRSRTKVALAAGRSPSRPSSTMTGPRWAPALVAPTTASVALRQVTTHAAVADGKANRFSASEVPVAVAVPTRSTVGAYRVAARATAVGSTVVSPTSTMRAGFSRSSSAAVDDGMPSGRVSSTPPPSRAAAATAPWPRACEVSETRKTTGAVVPVGKATCDARTEVA